MIFCSHIESGFHYCWSIACHVDASRDYDPALLGQPIQNSGVECSHTEPLSSGIDPCEVVSECCSRFPARRCVDNPCTYPTQDADPFDPSCGLWGVCCHGFGTSLMSEEGCSYTEGRWLGYGPFPPECGLPCNATGACCNKRTCACTPQLHTNCQDDDHTFKPCESCADVPSPCGTALGCCGCDWCCNTCSGSQDCKNLRLYPWENAPHASSVRCTSVGYLGQCGTTTPRPICRRAEFAVGRRPSAHEPPCTTPDPLNRKNRHELHSLNPIRARDLQPSSTDNRRCNNLAAPACDRDPECRIYYGHIGHGVPGRRSSAGWLCGEEHRCASDRRKRANWCVVAKRPDGRHSFECAYRSPCPERPALCT